MIGKTYRQFIGTPFHWIIWFVLVIVSVGCGTEGRTATPTISLPTRAIDVSPSETPDVENSTSQELEAGQICMDAFVSDVKASVLETPILTLFEDTVQVAVDENNTQTTKRWQYHRLESLEEISSLSLSEARTLVCVKETLESQGCYTLSGDIAVEPAGCVAVAVRRHWDIRSVRLQDKQVIGSTALQGGGPPLSVSVAESQFGGYAVVPAGANVGSEPIADLALWIQDRRTNTPVPPTPTPNGLGFVLPTGEPVAEWNGIPVMPDAIAGEELKDGEHRSYSFTVSADVETVEIYYTEELPERGWRLSSVDELGPGKLVVFAKGGELLSVDIFPADPTERLLLVRLDPIR